ncbi:hypothetical protein F3Y22_tig00012523pilonHSYRG00102 [Hibiscus syriacus]|uniref:Uncharacterized protein n=1 Tax=Hibiscus syriacus TaxID=106335 RepID=A0A6A3C2V0_HIBSY|nr:hypothetical protein F3Y22_tig00012523pilonHSYRG00102 [Hibiscus syriacus]
MILCLLYNLLNHRLVVQVLSARYAPDDKGSKRFRCTLLEKHGGDVEGTHAFRWHIPSESCVICKQTHGSCTQCCKCATHFHVMCASRAGYSMELHCLEKNGMSLNPDAVVVMHTPSGVFAARNVLQNVNECLRGSTLIHPRLQSSLDPQLQFPVTSMHVLLLDAVFLQVHILR